MPFPAAGSRNCRCWAFNLLKSSRWICWQVLCQNCWHPGGGNWRRLSLIILIPLSHCCCWGAARFLNFMWCLLSITTCWLAGFGLQSLSLTSFALFLMFRWNFAFFICLLQTLHWVHIYVIFFYPILCCFCPYEALLFFFFQAVLCGFSGTYCQGKKKKLSIDMIHGLILISKEKRIP